MSSKPPPASETDWYVYLVQCRDGTFYCGSTNRPAMRFAAHRTGRGARYTRSRGAAAMRTVACCLTRSAALKTEYRIKRLPHRIKQALWDSGISVQAAE